MSEGLLVYFCFLPAWVYWPHYQYPLHCVVLCSDGFLQKNVLEDCKTTGDRMLLYCCHRYHCHVKTDLLTGERWSMKRKERRIKLYEAPQWMKRHNEWSTTMNEAPQWMKRHNEWSTLYKTTYTLCKISN